MTDELAKSLTEASQAFYEHLEQAGFFKQIELLEENMKTVADSLGGLSKTATQRMEETESLAAHVIAIEAILTTLLRQCPVDATEVKEVIKETTGDMTDDGDGSPSVQQIATDILKRA